MTRIEYTIRGRFVGVDMVNRVLTPKEIWRYILQARREIGIKVKYNVTFE